MNIPGLKPASTLALLAALGVATFTAIPTTAEATQATAQRKFKALILRTVKPVIRHGLPLCCCMAFRFRAICTES